MRHSLTFLASLLFTAVPLSVTAQVVPDSTLPDDTIIAPNGKVINIRGGTARGDNLFHSFEQFSLLFGETAFFNNAQNIENIIGRVTGSSISEINGLIRANGTADLFLINPNGIIFGENASLDIGGSFIASTADIIKFADGREFSAVAPNASPLLTVSIPVGLQYGRKSGDITVRGAGNDLFINFDTFTVDRNERPVGLEVQPEKTLALVGGNVFLEGGNLTAPQGNIELGSVAGEGTVSFSSDALGWKLGYEAVSNFQEISLSEAASLEASGNGGGRVLVRGDYVSLTEGSAILADTLGNGRGGLLTIEAEETEIYGAADNGFTSSLFTNVDLGASGDGGELLIETGYLYVGEGAQVNVNTFGSGDGGNLTVRAEEIEVTGESADGALASGLFAQPDFGETGDGGNMSIETDYLLVADGAQISTTTFGAGDAGDLAVKASEIELIGAVGEFPSGLFVATEAEGDAGNLNLNTDYLLVADGAEISSTTFGAGDGGDLAVKASEIELIGGSAEAGPSGLFASAEVESSGEGGNVSLTTSSLSITNGARIAAFTNSLGNGGTLNLKAEEINLVGTSPGGNASGIFTNAEPESLGDGGNLTVETASLSIADGARISTTTFASGDGGSLDISAEEINLAGTSPGSNASGIFATGGFIESETIGAGGDVSIATNRLQVSEGAQIATSTAGSGDGGDLQIVASEFIRLSGNSVAGSSGLFANALSGNGSGGNINVTTGFLEILDGATINVGNFPSSDNSPFEPGLGAAGNLSIAANNIILNDGTISADTFTGDRGNIYLQTDLLLLRQGSRISTDAGGTSTGGNIIIDASNGFVIAVPQENSDITANAVLGRGGRVDITALEVIGIEPRLRLTPLSDITASSEFGVTGSINLQTQDLNPTEDLVELTDQPPPPQLARGCEISEALNSESRFVNLGRGGLSTQPNEALDSNDILGDVRVPQQWSKTETIVETSDRAIEAQGWIVNDRGNVVLVADTPSDIFQLACKTRSR